MKVLEEKVWKKSVRLAKNKPNYGMGEMDSLYEEVCVETNSNLLDP